MSMSTSVVGFKPPDEKWKEMKAIWDACDKAEIAIPDEVDEFFGGYDPDDRGVEVDLEDSPCCSVYAPEMKDGFEIDVTKLPKDVTIIRFWNSYQEEKTMKAFWDWWRELGENNYRVPNLGQAFKTYDVDKAWVVWEAALKEVLKQIDQSPSRTNGIVDWIKEQLSCE